MDRKKLILFIAAGVLAIIAGLMAKSLFSGGRTAPQAVALAPPAPTGPKVLVAQRGLPIGTIITPDAIGYQPWPKDMVDNAYFVEGESDLDKMLGTVVRQPITAGEPITRGALVAPGDRGFLAAALGPGMRAITVPVSAKTGVGGFVFPGDHVDLMLTQSVHGGDGPALKVAETILRNVRVLATDHSTESETSADGKTKVRAFRTVTLEVTPHIAEKVTVAQTIGTLSLSLRSIADNQSDLDKAIASGDVKVPDGASKSQEDAFLRAAVARPQDGASTFATGGDVSRFQRRTVPSDSSKAAPSLGEGGGGAAVKVGPIVRITRGDHTDAVSVGQGANGLSQSAHGLLGSVSKGMHDVGKTMPAAVVAP